jgi:hypothetical protein
LRIFPRDKELLLLPVQLHYPLSALLRECRYDLWADDIGERLRRPLAELQESFNTLARERPGRTEGRIKRSLRSYLLGLEAIRGMGAWRELKKAGVLNRLSVIAQGLAGRMRRDKAICKLCLELEQATHD